MFGGKRSKGPKRRRLKLLFEDEEDEPRASPGGNQARDKAPLRVPAFRFEGRGLGGVECLLRSVGGSGGVLYPVMQFAPSRTTGGGDDTLTAMLPPPSILGAGAFAVACVRAFGGSDDDHARNTSYRWPTPKQPPVFVGEEVAPQAPSAPSEPACAGVAALAGAASRAARLGEVLAALPVGGCPSQVLEATDVDGEYAANNQEDVAKAPPRGPPAVLRITAAATDQGHGQEHGQGGGQGIPTGGTAQPQALQPRSICRELPRCGEDVGSLPGRWLPIKEARCLVVNGAAIPASRTKYWVPFACAPTFWDLAALRLEARMLPFTKFA